MHLLSQSAVLRALGWCLFDSCWQMACLWVLYTAFIRIYKGASANCRHGLAVLLLGFGATWSVITFLQAFNTPDQPGTADWISSWIAGTSGTDWLTRIRQFLQAALSWCSAGYLLFLSWFLLRYIGHYMQSRRLRKQGLTKIAGAQRLFVEETARRMSIQRPVTVWLSSIIDVPATLGFFKPIILIPFATAANLSTPQLEAILLHELAHIKRNDYLVNLGVSVLEILFFFNPFTRLFIRDIKREREHRCDDLVMQFRYDPRDYVSALLSLAARGKANPQLALAAAGDNDRLLLRRARRILQLPQTRDRMGNRPLILLLGTLVISGLIALSLSTWHPDLSEGPQLIRMLSSMHDQSNNEIVDTIYNNNNVSGSPDGSGANLVNAAPDAIGSFASGSDLTSSASQPARAAIALQADGATIEFRSSSSTIDPVSRISTVSFQAPGPPPSARQCKEATPASLPLIVINVKSNKNNSPAKPPAIVMTASTHFSINSDGDDEDNGDLINHKTLVLVAEKRDFSIKTADKAPIPAPEPIPATTITPTAPSSPAPYVPNASFSYHFIQDSARPDQQFLYLQKQVAYEAEAAVKKVQAELELQLHILQLTDSQQEKQVILQKKYILEQQLKLQQDYLTRQRELIKRFEKLNRSKTAHTRRIVEI